MLTLERASKILLGAQSKQKKVHPLDYVYRSMQLQIQEVKPDDSEFYILN